MINELSLKQKRVLFAKLAGIAYNDVKDARREAKLLGFTKTVLIDIEGAQTYVFTSKTDCALACRGTEPSEMNDIYADLEIFKADSVTGYKVHQGFKEEVDKIYEKAINSGAVGGKLLGAGGGGFLLLYVEPEHQEKVIKSPTNRHCRPTRIQKYLKRR